MVGSWERAYGAAALLTIDGGCRHVHSEADGHGGGRGGNGSEAAAIAADEAASRGERLAGDLWLYGGTTTVACGTVGYALLLSVVVCSGRARSLRCASFVVVLSLAGVLRLVGLLSTLLLHQSCHRVAFAAVASDVGCRLGAAVYYLAAQAYAWMHACLAADGLRRGSGGGGGGVTAAQQIVASAAQPDVGRRRCGCGGRASCGCRRMPPAAAVIAGVLVLLLACIDTVPFVAFGQHADGLCAPLEAALAERWRYAHFVLYFAFPATVIVASHVAAVRWRRRRSSSSRGRSPKGGGRSGGSDVDEKKAIDCESALGAARLALNVTFVLTAAPDAFFANLAAKYDHRPDDSSSAELIRSACGLLAYAGCAAPFALCAAVGFRYRKALETMARASPKSNDAERCDCDHCGGDDCARNEPPQQQQLQSQRRNLAWLPACCFLCCRCSDGGGGSDSGERMQPVAAPGDGPGAAAAAASASDSIC